MQSFAQHLVELVLEDAVDFETAAAAGTHRHDFDIAGAQALRRRQALEDGSMTASEAGDVGAEEPSEGEPLGLRLAGT